MALDKRLFVIGDIHGCLDELKELMEKTDRDFVKGRDKYVFVGDYIDRGPNSYGVVEYLIRRSEYDKDSYRFLRGNHEDFILQPNMVYGWVSNGGRETLKSYRYNPMEHEHVLGCIPAKHWNFYRKTLLYYKEGRVVCAHAGLDPTKSLFEQSENDLLWSRGAVDYDGNYHDDVYVIYGHTPTAYDVRERNNSLGIDTGCVFGGSLTCVAVEPETATVMKKYQVKAHREY